ncbi:hypothetical protein CVV65_05475 [Kyrpidia spormannii]|uniref:Uncharacterized protein n=1 Tax=Kyrpidia spormannii TaxID=2055160 RepID=A0A2K8N576_9BACL|nr:DEAD/DEAH box helicase family protein [Kyrpidia spormannii]ATY84473.1 hypothetical protein CVV65_05475 [Kyrpidia spormannii]
MDKQRLRDLEYRTYYASGQHDLLNEFYLPCLRLASNYDRAVGYFNSSILIPIKPGLEAIVKRSGKIRIMAGAQLTEEDISEIRKGYHEREILNAHLDKIYTELQERVEHDPDIANLCWLIKNDILDIRISVPNVAYLEERIGELIAPGIFHDKIGIISDASGDYVVFLGSNNESINGWARNIESFEVYCSWDTSVSARAFERHKYFERLWEGTLPGVRTFEFPDAYKNKLIAIAPPEFQWASKGSSQSWFTFVNNKWRHQEEAIAKFLSSRNGILEMATGTGKTKTAIGILNQLHSKQEIEKAIVTVRGTDLLDQWSSQLVLETNLAVYRHYESFRDIARFIASSGNSVLVISTDFLIENIHYIAGGINPETTIIICDEIHGFGSSSTVKALKGRIRPFKYRLGLSATPEREYDEEGNKFIMEEIGPVIFEFRLEDAIKRGILCEFDYFPLLYELTDEDRDRIHRLIAAHNARKKSGELVSDEELYRQLAQVRKNSLAKIPIFERFIRSRHHILDRCIIFVETHEFGTRVQDLLIRYKPEYHTYFAEDDRINLQRFARGEIDCLLTSQRISEGIDIQSVDNIVLFTADRSRLTTIQRIGRSLRINPNAPDKRAGVVDFICTDRKDDNTDFRRMQWLSELSKIRWEGR